MLGLYPSAHITLCHIFGNIVPHISPPETVSEVLVHLITPWVYGVLRVVALSQNLSTNLLVLQDADTLFQPQGALLVDSEVSSLALP